MQETDDDEEELFEHHRIVVDKGQAAMRVDKFLFIKYEQISRNRIQNAIELKAVKVNDLATKASYKVKPSDTIVFSLPKPPRVFELIPQNIPLDIVYEDETLMIVNKPAGMVVHPAHGNWDGTLVNALVYHFSQLPTHRNGEIRPGLVHRIDKDTSGLLVIAKTDEAMTFLAKQFFDHSIERTYFAVVWGTPKKESGTIKGNVGRSLKDRKIMDVFEDESYGKHAVTHYQTLKQFKYASLLKCNLETGRSHQIRVHFKHIGHPLFNDATYGGDKVLRGQKSGQYDFFIKKVFSICPRQALHAKSLGFIHPVSKKWVQFDSELPEDMTNLIEEWEKYSN